jgi:hypothetical protein
MLIQVNNQGRRKEAGMWHIEGRREIHKGISE